MCILIYPNNPITYKTIHVFIIKLYIIVLLINKITPAFSVFINIAFTLAIKIQMLDTHVK